MAEPENRAEDLAPKNDATKLVKIPNPGTQFFLDFSMNKLSKPSIWKYTPHAFLNVGLQKLSIQLVSHVIIAINSTINLAKASRYG